MELKNKIAVVTGAASGIGRATAIEFARQGASVAMLDLAEDRLKETLALVEAESVDGAKATIHLCDVSDAEQMKSAADEVDTAHGRLDIIVAAAGINGVWAPIDELLVEEFDRTLAVNLRGTFLTMHVMVPLMKRSPSGSIIVISSMLGTRTFTVGGATAYITTKAGQLAMVNQLALELSRYRIRVNAVCPGQITTHIDESTERRKTEQTHIKSEWPDGTIPLTAGEPGQPQDIANTITFLASDRASHITGSPIWVDGGQSLLL